ncbi:MAG: type II secretion system F family protein [Acidimicrobiia bacterium]|nr:type II secretion system F family protein [Acidimicrobiia bacterium]
MILGLICGAGVGLGALLVVRGIRPPRPALASALERLRPGYEDPVARSVLGGRLELQGARVGERLALAVDKTGLRLASTRADLAATGKPLERFYLDKVVLAIFGFVFIPAVIAAASMAGVSLPVIVPVWVSLVFGVIGFFLPDLLIRGEAAEARRNFRHALSAFLELVRINLAGGAGIESALHDSVDVGSGWAFGRLREALALARLSGETPWAALGRLGVELRIEELIELSSSLVLAGSEGAKIKESLAAKAESLRRHEAAIAEAKAQEASERMSVPIAVLLFGFLIFLGYPAVAHIFTSL